jgi:predicted PurR-regulated permease PerM
MERPQPLGEEPAGDDVRELEVVSDEAVDKNPPAPEPHAPPALEGPAPVVVPRWIQAVGLAVALFGLFMLARAAGPVLLLFIVAGVIALILNPLVKLLQRAGLPRGAAIAVVVLGFFAVVAGTVALLVNPVSDQIQAFQEDLPSLIDNANASLASLQQRLDERGLGIQIASRGETALETLRSNVLRGSGDVLSFARDLVTLIVEAGFAMILILVLTIYVLLYGKQIGALVRRVMPPGDGTPEDDYPIRVQKAVFGYVRGQLTFSLVMGVSAGLALWIFGVLGIFPAGQTYAIFFGAFYGFMELIPYVGPVLGSLPPILVALFQGEPLTAVWLGLLFLVLQQLEGHVVAPQIFSYSLRMNPIVVIFVLLLGGHFYGIVGALVALPLAAIARETTMYLSRHLVLEPWGTPSAAALRDEPPAVETRPARRRCPQCGTAAMPSAEFCFACGTPVRPQVRSSGGKAPSEHPTRRGTLLPAWPLRRPRRPGTRRTINRRTTPVPEQAAVTAPSAPDSDDTPQ